MNTFQFYFLNAILSACFFSIAGYAATEDSHSKDKLPDLVFLKLDSQKFGEVPADDVFKRMFQWLREPAGQAVSSQKNPTSIQILPQIDFQQLGAQMNRRSRLTRASNVLFGAQNILERPVRLRVNQVVIDILPRDEDFNPIGHGYDRSLHSQVEIVFLAEYQNQPIEVRLPIAVTDLFYPGLEQFREGDLIIDEVRLWEAAQAVVGSLGEAETLHVIESYAPENFHFANGVQPTKDPLQALRFLLIYRFPGNGSFPPITLQPGQIFRRLPAPEPTVWTEDTVRQNWGSSFVSTAILEILNDKEKKRIASLINKEQFDSPWKRLLLGLKGMKDRAKTFFRRGGRELLFGLENLPSRAEAKSCAALADIE